MLNGNFQQRSSGLRRSTVNGTIIRTAATSLMIVAMMAGKAQAADDAHAKAEPARPITELVPVCASCHGEDGTAINDTIPHLGGQHRDYLAYSLKSYKNGVRDNAIMKGMVADLTNEEMESLARYYSRQADVVYTPSRSTWRAK